MPVPEGGRCQEARRKRLRIGVLGTTWQVGIPELVQLLVQEFDADPDQACNDGSNPIHVAAAHGHADAVRVLGMIEWSRRQQPLSIR